jgi:predicted phosphodiesterase
MLSLALVGCLNIAEDRARIDEKIGHAELQGLSVRVIEGSGAVRSLSSLGGVTTLWLWAQTPALKFHIKRSDEASVDSISLKISNVMVDSELRLTSNDSVTSILPTTRDELPTVVRAQIPIASNTHTVTLTPPQPPSDQPWQFALFADVQERIDGLSDLLIPLGQERVRFALISGDLTSMGKVHELLNFQEGMEAHLPFPCYATLGNHELGTPGIPFHRLFGRGSYSFTYGGARFTLLDGASATLAPRSRRALDRWLDEGRDQTHVVATHIPLLDPDGTRGGAFASRLEAAEILSSLKTHRVDLLLYGHVHTYRYFHQAGIPTIISGGGGSIPMRLDGIGRHYVVFELDHSTDETRISHHIRRIYPEE